MKKTKEGATSDLQGREVGRSRDTMAGLLNRVQGMSESSRILSDEIFKTLFQYKYVVAKVLKAASSDFAPYSLGELIKGICDVSAKYYASDKELYTSKIDVLNLEDKAPGEKEIKYDLVFQMSLPDKKRSGKTEGVLVNFTIDLEMQKENPSYSLPARGIYYAASLLRNTLQAGADYTHIHKVFSLWFCGRNCITGALSDQHYRHSYRIVRTYGESGEEVTFDQEADLMEVIFIELQKQDQLKQNEVEELGKALDSIFKNPKKTLEELTDRFGSLNCLAMNKEVNEMISKEEFGEITRREGRQEGLQEGLREGIFEAIRFCYQGLVDSGKSEDEAIELTASLLRQKENDVRKIIGEKIAI